MGNNGSRTGHISSLNTEPTWTQSFPKTTHGICQQHKVLPEKGLNKKLRSTNNGEILYSGGTISGRQYQEKTLSLERENKPFKIFRTNSISSNSPDDHQEITIKPYTRSYQSHHGGVIRYAAQRFENNNIYKEQTKKYGSEPDLRNSSPNARSDSSQYKGKKKYKAPPPPNQGVLENININSSKWNENVPDPLLRRSRLFKTKTELQKRCSSPINHALDLRLEKSINSHKQNDNANMFNVELRNHNKHDDKNNRLSLPEIIRTNSIPEFQNELKQAVLLARSSKTNKLNTETQNEIIRKYDKKPSDQSAKKKIKTLDHNINNIDHVKSRLKSMDLNTLDYHRNMQNMHSDRSHTSDKESLQEKNNEVQILEKKGKPSNRFYFGMKEPIGINLIKTDNNDINTNHSPTFQPYNEIYSHSSKSGSDISSELEIDEGHISTNRIALQLRPILPKKQLDIPRFSPATAWKQLSAVESNYAPSTVTSDDFPIFMEDRIQKLSRPPPPLGVQTGPRSSYDKSGDSGISGDAGPIGFDDSPDGIVNGRNNIDVPSDLNINQGMSWTPQQDLGEEESSTDEEMHKQNQILNTALVKFSPNPNVFSLSLPRDNQLSSYINRNFKNRIDDISNSFIYQRGNWFLSKSAPNSLNNGLNSETSKFQKLEEPKPQVVNNVQNVSRVMYLPDSITTNKKHQCAQIKNERPQSKDIFCDELNIFEFSNLNNYASLSKSFENITSRINSSGPEDLQDPPMKRSEPLKIYKPKRFTFQSTIRQIERKRLAERLSKEAEQKEKQRLSELAAMQRVEEEFQRKRAREKACIRQQLRLFSLDDTVWSSTPSDDVKNVPARSDPDGAVSSTTSSPLPLGNKSTHLGCLSEEESEKYQKKSTPIEIAEECVNKTQMTLILSEYRQPQREYKDFRGSARYMVEFVESHNAKQTTVHPQVTYNIPKASNAQQGCSNYRKQFAHGVKSSRSGDSSYSDDSQPVNRNSSPKVRLKKSMPVSRF